MRVFVDSTYRSTGTEQNYSFRFPEWALNRIKNIRLLSAELPKVAYTITTAFNDLLKYTDGGTATIVNMTEDNYTPSELATHLTTLLTTASGTTTVSYDSSKNKFSIDNQSGATLVFPAISQQQTQVDTGTASSSQSGHDVYKLLGLDTQSALTITNTNSSELPNQADFNMLPYVMINLSTSTGRTTGIVSDLSTYSFTVLMNRLTEREYSDTTEEGIFKQDVSVKNYGIDEVRIEILPNSNMPTGKMFHGLNHYLVFDFS